MIAQRRMAHIKSVGQPVKVIERGAMNKELDCAPKSEKYQRVAQAVMYLSILNARA